MSDDFLERLKNTSFFGKSSDKPADRHERFSDYLSQIQTDRAPRRWKCRTCGCSFEDRQDAEKCPTCHAGPSSIDEIHTWQCKVCGFLYDGPQPPDICPVCFEDSSHFSLCQI